MSTILNNFTIMLLNKNIFIKESMKKDEKETNKRKKEERRKKKEIVDKR